MSIRKRTLTLLCFTFLFSPVFTNAVYKTDAQASEAITVTDFRGRTLTLKKPVQRIVCLIESALSGLYMLHVQDRVVGVSTSAYGESVFPFYASLDERMRSRSIPAPGNWDFVNIESVMAIEPDLVIIWSHQIESIRALESRGIPVYGVFIRKFSDVYTEILDLGILTGQQNRAKQLVEYTKKQIHRFSGRVRSLVAGDRVSVYYMWAQGELETSGSDSTVDEMISLAGATNICGDIPQEHLIINMEMILAKNPQVIVMWYNERMDPEDILHNPRWRAIRAVQNGRVHELPSVFTCDLWTLKFQYAVKMTSKWCYPETFGSIDLDAERKDMFKELYGRGIHIVP